MVDYEEVLWFLWIMLEVFLLIMMVVVLVLDEMMFGMMEVLMICRFLMLLKWSCGLIIVFLFIFMW